MSMNHYDRVMAVLRGRKERIDRLPCMNPVSTATKEFMKATDAWWPDAHKDPEKMAKLGSAAHKICGLDNVTIPFDMVVEAEVLGASVNLREEAFKRGKILWPGVKKFVINEPYDIKIPQDVSAAGRIPVIEKAIKILRKEFEGKVPINVFMNPPFTCVSSYLVDTIRFMKMIVTSPDEIHGFLETSMDVFIEIAKIYEEAGADIITLHEMGASTDNISPSHFETLAAPYVKELVNSVKCPTILNICGSAESIIDKMVKCGASAMAIDERTQMDKARTIVDKIRPGYPIIGNISSRKVIHAGPIERIRDSVKEAIEQGVDIVAPGCDFWIETPTEHIKALVNAAASEGKVYRT